MDKGKNRPAAEEDGILKNQGEGFGPPTKKNQIRTNNQTKQTTMKTQVTINTRGSMDVFNVLASAGIIATCDAHMNMVVSDTDLARIRNEYPAAWDDMYVVNDERVDDVECTRDGHQGITITYTLDGVPYEVTGEFLIDKAGVLHHWCEDADGDEIEVCVQYN